MLQVNAPWLIWTKLFLLNFHKTKTGVRPFKAGVLLFEQAPTYANQWAPVWTYSEGKKHFFIFKNSGLQNQPQRYVLPGKFFETCVDLFKIGAYLFLNRRLLVLKQLSACFELGSVCFIQVIAYLNQAGACLKTGKRLFLNRWVSILV